jgi:hypothetical protein
MLGITNRDIQVAAIARRALSRFGVDRDGMINVGHVDLNSMSPL